MKTAVCIPARMASTRFPGKPLALIRGKPMVIRVWENAVEAVGSKNTFILTDSEKIMNTVQDYGAQAIMTSSNARSGTERIASVLDRFDHEIIVNMQGDEPFFKAVVLTKLIEAFRKEEKAQVLSSFFPLSPSAATDPNRVKVVLDKEGYALYFSRAPIPSGGPFLKHIGIYLFRRDFIKRYLAMDPGKLETSEKLEQLRILESGYSIKMIRSDEDSPGIDTPEDLKRAEELHVKG